MTRPEYLGIPIKNIPQAIIDSYNLQEYVVDGIAYFKVNKGMYGLPQAGKIANDQLIEFLKLQVYKECNITLELWRHETRDITFWLVVNDFGIKYDNNLQHLLMVPKKHYKVSIDMKGEKFLEIKL
mmetsp:Transcript_9681/g.13929  ORF Transcript_9681/g.13929 Transcript_9681/m.13929 type:complete len:126 (+) Transcript_9681:412-789(+)